VRINANELLFDALEGKLTLFVVANKDAREALIPYNRDVLFHASAGEFIHQYEPLFGDIEYVDVKLWQDLDLTHLTPS